MKLDAQEAIDLDLRAFHAVLNWVYEHQAGETLTLLEDAAKRPGRAEWAKVATNLEDALIAAAEVLFESGRDLS